MCKENKQDRIERRTLGSECKIKEATDSAVLKVTGLQSANLHSHCAAAEFLSKVSIPGPRFRGRVGERQPIRGVDSQASRKYIERLGGS